MSILDNYPNYKLNNNYLSDKTNPFKVISVDGFSMLLNLKD